MITRPDNCIDCARRMIPQRQRRDPSMTDVVVHDHAGRCRGCASRHRRHTQRGGRPALHGGGHRTPAACSECGVRLKARGATTPGTRHEGRGLCRRCVYAATSTAPRLRRRAHVLEDWLELAPQLGGSDARTSGRIGWDKETRRRVAARLGMTTEALERQIYRATRH